MARLMKADEKIEDNFFKKYSKYILYALLVFVIICRIVSIKFIPDVYIDESMILDHFKVFISGSSIENNINNLYFPAGVGLTTYTYFYPMISVLYVVGADVFKARLVQQIFTIIACVFLAQGVKIWSDNNEELFWICLFVSLTLPWNFVQANRIWDPSFVPLYFSIYFYSFALLMKSEELSNLKAYVFSGISFGFLVFLAVVYPPCRIPAVLMWLISLYWAFKENKINFKHIIFLFALSALLSIPLAYNILFNSDFNYCTQKLLIFYSYPFIDAIKVYITNFISLINPLFLFVSGDVNYRHGLPIFGVLGTISIVPLIALIFKRKINEYSSLCRYMIFIIVTTYLSVALTRRGMYHSLRACLCWMPFTILISYGWYYFLMDKSSKQKLMAYSTILLFFIIYFVGYVLFFKNGLYA